MAYFIVTSLKVIVLFLGLTQGTIQGKTPDYTLLADILQTLFKSYTQSLRESRNFFALTKRTPDTPIEKFIRSKVEDLGPLLQDNDDYKSYTHDNDADKNVVDDNVTLDGEEETTIIEFQPETDNQKGALRISNKEPQSFKENVQKYTKIRDQIKDALIEEAVSPKTQKLVTHTLDDMLAIMVRSQCPEHNVVNDNKFRENPHPRTIGEATKDLAKNWTEQWNTIKSKYKQIWSENFSTQPNPIRKLFMFFEQIQEFLMNISNDTEHISNHYKVVCKLVKSDNKEDNFNNLDLVYFRDGDEVKKHKCPGFKVCSEELKLFMFRLFNNLNDTAVSTFRNYAAMYISDVNSDGSGEKGNVFKVINRLGDTTEQHITKVFKKETTKFELDRNKNKNENYNRLRMYVNEVVDKSVKSIKSSLHSRLVSLRARLIEIIQQDLISNINVDLENLAADLRGSICRDFSTCKGQITMRRSFDGFQSLARQRPIDKNKVYVKLQMNFDQKLKDEIAKGNIDFMDYAFMPVRHLISADTSIASIMTLRPANVTRTTLSKKSTGSIPRSIPTKTSKSTGSTPRSIPTKTSKSTRSTPRSIPTKSTAAKFMSTRMDSGEKSNEVSTEIVHEYKYF